MADVPSYICGNEYLLTGLLREMASEDCVLSLGSSDPNYRTKQMASDDALDPGSRVNR